MSSTGISIILYPRSYNKRGAENLHSVKGVTSNGVEVNVKLRIDEKYTGKPYSPSIKEFSRTDRSAKSPCIATKDNGPDKREGVLLFSRAEVDPLNKTKTPTYIAKWAVILASDSSSPDPIIGIGRLDISRNGAQMEKIRASIESLEKAGKSDNKNEIRTLKRQIKDSRNFSYPAIIYYPDKVVLEQGTPEEFADACKQAIEHIEGVGAVLGLLFRARDDQGDILDEFTAEIFQKYRPDIQGYEPASLVVDRWSETLREDLVDGIKYEAIPLAKFNNGWRGNNYYGSPGNYEKILGTYFDDANAPLVCRVAVRVSHYPDQDLTLVSRVFPLSPPIGRPNLLNKDGTIDGETNEEEEKHATGIRMTGRQALPLQRDPSIMSKTAHEDWDKPRQRKPDDIEHVPAPSHHGIIPDPAIISVSDHGEQEANHQNSASTAPSNRVDSRDAVETVVFESNVAADEDPERKEDHTTETEETAASDDNQVTSWSPEADRETKLEPEEGEPLSADDSDEKECATEHSSPVGSNEETSLPGEAAQVQASPMTPPATSDDENKDNAASDANESLDAERLDEKKAAPVTGMAAFLARKRNGA